MANSAGTIEILAREFALVFQPLEQQLADGDIRAFLAVLGLALPPVLSDAFEVGNEVGDAVVLGLQMVEELPPLVTALVDAIANEDIGEIVGTGQALIPKVQAIVEAVTELANAIDRLANTAASLTPADVADLREFAAELPRRLIDRLLIEYLAKKSEAVVAGLRLLGIIEIREDPGVLDNPLRPPWNRHTVHYPRIVTLLTDPAALAREVYGWGNPDFDGVELFTNLQTFLEDALRIESDLLVPQDGPAVLEVYALAFAVDDTASPPGVTVSLRFQASGQIERDFPIVDGWELQMRGAASFASDVRVDVRPPLSLVFRPPTGTAQVDLSQGIARVEEDDSPFVIFGVAGGSRLEAKQISGTLGLSASWDTSGGAEVEPSVAAGIEGGKLVITGAGGDGFISELLAGVEIEAEFDLGFTWTPSRGLEFEGGAGLSVELPLRLELGPLRLDALHLGLGLEDAGAEANPALTVSLGASVGAALGPVAAAVRNIGAKGKFSFPKQGKVGGGFGGVDFGIDFLPPTGVALSMTTPAVKLAGLLDIDVPAGRYVGAVELNLIDFLDLSAIAIINTRFPDGSEGFSLLFIISTQFPTPIHLGYNFFLAGVGGLLGLHRSVDLDRMRAAVQTGSLANVLFPEDVVANFQAIVSDLGEMFPVVRDQFVVGPMFRLTWNTPALLTIDLGLVIEFPEPLKIAILGHIRAAIPDPEAPIIDIKVAFLGAIDFQRELLSFDASIYDSFIGAGAFKISFEGDMALRLSWGARSDFLLSVGGFHPQYTPPTHLSLPARLERVTVSLLKDNPRLQLTAYFALTTNTVQFGAGLDFYFDVSAFNVVGKFGFDVLFQFSPFRFIASVYAHLAVRSGSSELFGIRLEFELAGPTPWSAKGVASFKILFFTVKVRFTKTWGEKKEISLPDVAILDKVVDEFENDRNWQARPAAGASPLVRIERAAVAEGVILLDAAGVLTISQNLVPLGVELERFGNAIPSDLRRVDIKAVRVGPQGFEVSTLLTPIDSDFAPANFKALSDGDKLRAASYERLKGGVEARSGGEVHAEFARRVDRPVEYERIELDADDEQRTSGVEQDGSLFQALVVGGAIGSSAGAKARKLDAEASAATLVMAQERFAVVARGSFDPFDADSQNLSRSEAETRVRKLAGSGVKLEIVPTYELAG